MLTLTPNAVAKVKEIYTNDKSLSGKSLRVFVGQGHGCSSYEYGFSFDEAKDGDTTLPYDGFQVVVDAPSATLLTGSVIDFKEDFSGGGFAISNPNAKRSCGCGKSFDA